MYFVELKNVLSFHLNSFPLKNWLYYTVTEKYFIGPRSIDRVIVVFDVVVVVVLVQEAIVTPLSLFIFLFFNLFRLGTGFGFVTG